MSFYITEETEDTLVLLHDLPVNIGPDDEDEDDDDDLDFEEDEDLNEEIDGDDLLATNNGIDFDEIDRPGFDDDDEDDDLFDDDL
jgi:hypothetical protein